MAPGATDPGGTARQATASEGTAPWPGEGHRHLLLTRHRAEPRAAADQKITAAAGQITVAPRGTIAGQALSGEGSAAGRATSGAASELTAGPRRMALTARALTARDLSAAAQPATALPATALPAGELPGPAVSGLALPATASAGPARAAA